MTPERFVAAACRRLGVSPARLRSPRRDTRAVDARCVVAKLLRDGGWGLSLPEIGRLLNRDHTTVINLLGRCEQSPRLMVDVETCWMRLNGMPDPEEVLG